MAPEWTPLAGPSHAIALEVLLHGPLSRATLARRLDLSPGSLSRLTKPLLERGLLVELDETRAPENGIGRPERPLDVVASSHHFVGIKLTGTEAHGVTTTLRAEITAAETVPLPDADPGAVVDVVSDLVRRLASNVPVVTAVGVSIGGHAQDHKVVSAAPFLGWRDVPLAEKVGAATGLPTVVENDLIALTEAESWFGAGTGLDQFAVVTVGAGVGFGLVVRGHQVTSSDFGLGLVGHVPLDPTGGVCFYGHRGCAAAMLTMESVSSGVSVALGRRIGYDEALDLAADGDPAARRVVDDSGRALGRLLALVANFTMPQRIVLSGEGNRLAVVAREAMEDALQNDRDPRAQPVDIELRPGDFTQWARGAAVIAIQTYVLGRD